MLHDLVSHQLAHEFLEGIEHTCPVCTITYKYVSLVTADSNMAPLTEGQWRGP